MNRKRLAVIGGAVLAAGLGFLGLRNCGSSSKPPAPPATSKLNGDQKLFNQEATSVDCLTKIGNDADTKAPLYADPYQPAHACDMVVVTSTQTMDCKGIDEGGVKYGGMIGDPPRSYSIEFSSASVPLYNNMGEKTGTTKPQCRAGGKRTYTP